MQKIDLFWDETPMPMDTLGLELKNKEIHQAQWDSLSQERVRPIASGASVHERVSSTGRAQLELFGPHYYHWGLNE
jgi:hypothetical protein